MDTPHKQAIYIFDLSDHGDGRTSIELPVPNDELLGLFSGRLGATGNPRPLSASTTKWRFSRCQVPSVKDKLECYRALERMTSMGLKLPDALLKTTELTRNLRLQYALACTVADIQFGGKPASEAFGCHPDIFSPAEIGQIQAGENTGSLDKTFLSIATHLEMMEKVVSQMLMASLYPIGLCSVLYLIISGLLYFAIPPLNTAFKAMGAQLPMATKMLINLSETLVANPWMVAIGPILAILGYAFRPTLMPILAILVRRLPLISGYYLRAQMAQSIATLATLIHGGIPLPTALRLVSGSTVDTALKRAYTKAYNGVEAGDVPMVAFTEVFRYFGDISADFRAALEVGHFSGDIPTSLFQASKNYQRDFIRVSEAVGKLLEPLMTVIIGVVVGAIVFAGYYPIITATQSIK